jgi:two-component system, cell cycle sensor histidine kinase and response regulator CckA
MRILIAEDNEFYRGMLEETLAEWGYEVVGAADGEAAWQVLRAKDAPRLAILDWIMPGLDGIEVCRRVRALDREEPTYLILLTARSGKENIIAALKGGADDYICKPFDREELHARLQVGLRIVGLQSSLADRVHELEQALSGAQKMEAVGRLAGGVAHDFNNLLTVILGSSEILLKKGQLDKGDHELIRMVKDAGERGAGLTRQLLTFSRRHVQAPEILSLSQRVAGVEKMLRRLIGEDVNLVTNLDPAVYPVLADAGQVEQVIMNLVVNSRDAMPDGGTVTIETRNVELDDADTAKRPAVRPGSYALLSVSDTGCGMDEETKQHLFEPFFTTKEVGKGTGLGLATVYGIVKHSDGHIAVESKPGRGATFRIYLPKAARPPETAAVLKNGRPGGPAANGHETILLVEDEEAVRTLARTILQDHHYTVLEARDGAEAMQVSSRWPKPIDLMVTDVVMPRLSGNQLADRLMPIRPDMKVLFMSAYPGHSIAHHGVLGPGTHFLQKPFTPDVFTRTVRDLLDQRQGARRS